MSAGNREGLTDPNTVLLCPTDEVLSTGSPVLVVIRGERLGARLDISGGPLVIGRSSESDFRIAARSVSRTHCRVSQQGQSVWVEDLGSTNRTFVNDEVIDRRQLRDGDQLRVGKTVLKFLGPDNPEAHYLAEMHESSIRDSLTGMYNRAHAMQVLEEEFRRSQRLADARLVLAIIDIDWFKQINDEIGHLAGDAVLVHLARVLGKALRAGDTLARIGGEEFALIMPDTSLQEAHQACDRLRQRVADESFLTDCGKRLEVTISIGLAEATPQMTEFRELLGEADSHLYDAKTAGRNSVRSRAA
ncbi:diguanylate cyclase [Wenzhouxiangella limi]|uniref:diguanylate cyclase n=1 Tax=Wenzhouxiangella limi TaxID=2707351 RepID=A0A845UWA8_9GAMM|nr:GGDEF domain-containing protein [Wenzhouxiangella limi]NDY94888.1 GGDEF domain-containing protein [Wenzhouxiangella limi]